MRNREKACKILKFVLGAIVVVSFVTLVADVAYSMFQEAYSYKKLFLMGLYVLIPYTLVHLTVYRFKTLPIYVLVNAIPVILILVLPLRTLMKAALILISGMMVAMAASARMQETEDFTQKPHAAFLGMIVALYLISGGFEAEPMMRVNYYLAFAYAILFVIYSNFRKLNDYLDINKDVENIPYRQISRTNYGTLAIYLILMIALMIILPLIGIDKLAMNLIQALKDLLAKLVNIKPVEEAATSAAPTDQPYDQPNPFDGWTENETPAWLTFLYTALTWVAAGALIAGGIALVIFGISRMMKQFANKDLNETDREEFISSTGDVKESTFSFNRILKRAQERFDRTPNAQVRRFYKKTLLKQGKEPPKDSMTPEEAESFVGLKSDENRTRLHELYEKARYSEEGCDKEDLKLIHN